MADSDAALIALKTRVDKLPTNLDFAFAYAAIEVLAKGGAPDGLAKIFSLDPLYEGGATTALQLPTFIGNHDMGRFAGWVQAKLPKADRDEQLKRDLLAHAMLLTLRGVPTIYYGDEQGFVGGGDQDARQDMFASKVASYNAEALVGTTATTATDNFNTNHPLYRAIAELARIRTASPALTRGLQRVRFSSDKPGLFAVSRFAPGSGDETLLLFNTSTAAITQNVVVETSSARFTAAIGACPAVATAPGSVHVVLAPLSYAVCHVTR